MINDGLFYVNEVTRCVGIYTGSVFYVLAKMKKELDFFQYHFCPNFNCL